MASSSAGKTKLEATSKAAVERQEVRVSTTPIRPAIARDQRKDDFEVLVTVEAPKVVAPEKRAPIDLVAVLDVSGSMNKKEVVRGKQTSSRLDLLKIAMKYIIKLVRDADRLAIVSFNDQLVDKYTIELTKNSKDGRKKLENLVDKLKAGGDTAFRPGLKKAVEILDGRGKEEKKKRMGFIVFLSDGVDVFKYSRINWEKVAKSTDHDHAQVRAMLRKYAVHTFGFSASHDPMPLKLISALSYGLYSFVCKDLDNITEAFARCLGGLRTVAAAEICVDLKPLKPKSNVSDKQLPVLIRSIDSGGYESQVIDGGTSGKILIPVLYVDEVKKFIVHLKVPKVSSTSSQQEILTADGECRNANSDDGKKVRIKQHKLAIRRPPKVVDEADLRPAPQVVEQVVVFKVLEMVPKTFQSTRDGKDLKNNEYSNTKVAVQLQRNMDEIRRSNVWTDLDVGTRRRIDEQLKEIADHVEKGEGPAYVSSWVSSQEMQRATTMGSPNKVVPEFVTPAMKAIVEEVKKPLEEIVEGEPSTPTSIKPTPSADLTLTPRPEIEKTAPTSDQKPRPVLPSQDLAPISIQPPPDSSKQVPAVAAQAQVVPPSSEEISLRCPRCVELDIVDDHLAYWSNVKRDLLRVLEDVETAAGLRHGMAATSCFHDLSLGVINQTMYQSVCQAVEQARSLSKY